MSYEVGGDPTPLTLAQTGSLLRAAARELSWSLREVAHEISACRAAARAIPDAVIRDDALYALASRRTNTDGAALFSALPDRRDAGLLRLLTAYQAIWDFLDSLGERHPTEANGRELHTALVDALDPARPLADYFRHHPHHDDGGYLATLVRSCRDRVGALPSYERVRPLVVREARRAQVQALNHIHDRSARDGALESWVEREFPRGEGIVWYEVTAAASASLAIHPLLALAARADLSAREVAAARAAYWPWVSLATTMLDNYADRAEDLSAGNHNYFSHYRDDGAGLDRLREHISRSTTGALGLRDGHRHAVVVASMVAMYLSKDDNRSPEGRRAARCLVQAGGSLVRLLIPILRAWRIAYSQRST